MTEARPVSGDEFRLLVESVVDYAIFMLDPRGYVASWNRGAQRIKGYEPSEIIGQHFSRFYPEADLATGKPAHELEVANAVGRFEDEGWRLRKDGSRFWANVVITAMRGPDGELRGFGKVTRDLTSRRLGEQAAVISGQLQAILEGVGDGISVLDRSGQLRYVNTAAARLSGFSSVTDMLSTPPEKMRARFELVSEDGKPFDREQLPAQLVLQGEESASAIVGVRDRVSGRTWWSDIRATALRGAKREDDLAINVWNDISARRRDGEARRHLYEATATLSSSLDYEATLAAFAHTLVPTLADWCAVDILEDGALVRVAVAHVDPQKVEFAKELQRRYPSDISNTERGIGAVLRTGRSEMYQEITDEMLVQGAKDPEHLAISRALGLRSAIVVPIKVRDTTFGILTLVAAESGRRYDERDLALAEELGHRGGIAIENARLFREAQHAVRLREDFLSVAGHELRTPLAALDLQLQGLAKSLAQGDVADLPKWHERTLKTIAHSRRLQRLINELLDVSRIRSGKLELTRERFDVVALLREILERHQDILERAGCSIELQTEGSTLGNWDRARLDQVLTNLVDNAAKYGRGKPVLAHVVGTAGRVRVSIRDNGIGIDPEHHPRIFGRFERAVSVRHYGGLGLGLWIAREIVEAHGGAITFESAAGAGATFIVDLPTEGKENGSEALLADRR